MIESILQWDQFVFQLVNQGLSNPIFDLILPPIRGRAIWIPLYLFFAYLLYKRFDKKGIFVFLLALMCAGSSDIISSHIIKPSIERPRPCHSFTNVQDITLRVRCGRGYSFTSSHATNHFAIAWFFVLVLGTKRARFLLLFWAGAISFAQVYVGVHYPLDVIVGTLLGTLIGILFGKIAKHTIKKYIYTLNQNTA